ncbi:MAG: ABC transporter ATP-binding protein [Anaerolineae bacterium]|nr:ABC transporter ATP-binding protein [Anaerolineae bacterium]
MTLLNTTRTSSSSLGFSDRYLLRMMGKFLRPFLRDLLLVLSILLGVSLLSLLPPFLIQQAVDGPIATGDLNALWSYATVYIVSLVIVFILRFLQTYLLQTVGQNALVNLRQTLFEHILKQDIRFFTVTPVGQLVARLSNDIESLTELLSTSIVVVITNLITLLGIVVVMFALNWRLAVIALVVLPLIVVVTVYFRRLIRASSSRYHGVVGDYLAYLNEQFNGMLVVQLFGRQDVSRADFDAINRRYRDVHMEMRDQYTIYASILQVLTSIGLAILLYGGGIGVLAQWASLGMLIAFIQYSRRTFEPIQQLAEQFSQIQTALSAGERIAKMLHIEPSICEPATPVRPKKFQGEISFDHVTFSYEPGTVVLNNLNIEVRAGERIAIVGATGAGKTSLAGLLGRFYDVDSGGIYIDGVDIRQMSLADLRRYVTVVPQTPFCFNGTVADNLRLFDPAIPTDTMRVAAQTACAAPFIEKLPNTYDYQLLPGGANLSHGQRQLIALARALLHNPQSILILDEATSNIDTETEILIQRGLDQVLKGRTSIVIAHRLSTIRYSDRILVMQQGQVVEQGTHDELLQLNGLYRQLYDRQFAEE